MSEITLDEWFGPAQQHDKPTGAQPRNHPSILALAEALAQCCNGLPHLPRKGYVRTKFLTAAQDIQAATSGNPADQQSLLDALWWVRDNDRWVVRNVKHPTGWIIPVMNRWWQTRGTTDDIDPLEAAHRALDAEAARLDAKIRGGKYAHLVQR